MLCDWCGTLIVICFFFQAEDGIRDRNVTGVQTCALPISYAMHKQEIESLQARLKALESTQKHQISAPSIIAEHVEQAIKRSEERRVGKERRCRERPAEEEKNMRDAKGDTRGDSA